MVLSRNTAPDGAPETFHGRQIYTVYLDVGTAKQWILHFSSADPQVRMSGNVIRIAAVEPIEAPYPQITIIPSADIGFGNNPVSVSGILDAEGKLRALRLAGNPDAETSGRFMALLERWSFRPAKKASLPTDVAIVLVVPKS